MKGNNFKFFPTLKNFATLSACNPEQLKTCPYSTKNDSFFEINLRFFLFIFASKNSDPKINRQLRKLLNEQLRELESNKNAISLGNIRKERTKLRRKAPDIQYENETNLSELFPNNQKVEQVEETENTNLVETGQVSPPIVVATPINQSQPESQPESQPVLQPVLQPYYNHN